MAARPASTDSGPRRVQQPDRPCRPAWEFSTNTRHGLPAFSPNSNRRGIGCHKLLAPDHFYDPGARDPRFSAVFNRMSSSADRREHGRVRPH
jgi:hypothetical protein